MSVSIINKVASPLKRHKRISALKAIVTSFNGLFLFLFLLIAMYAGLCPSQNKFKLFVLTVPLVISAMALAGLLILVAGRKVQNSKIRSNSLIIVLIFIGTLAVQYIIGHSLQSTGYTWDSQEIFNQASKFATHGTIDTGYVKYLLDNPNNIALLAALGGLFKACMHFGIHDFMTVAVNLNVLLLWLAQVLTYLVAKMLYGKRIALISILFSFVFINLTMYVQIPYTDSLTIIFPILLLYLSLRIVKAKRLSIRIGLAAIIGAITLMGYLIKPTVLIALVALLVTGAVWLISAINRKNWKSLSALVASCTLAGFAVISGSYVLYHKAVDRLQILPYPIARSNDVSKPPIHFAAIGITTHTFSNKVEYGGFDPVQNVVISSLPTEQAKKDYSVKIIHQRLHDYGFWGYFNFLKHKANWILSDATFYAYGEGTNDKVVFAHHDLLSRAVRHFMFVYGGQFILFADILQVFWLALLILIGVQFIILILNKSSRVYIFALTPRLMIAGILLFLLLFEGRSRYIFLYVPIFIICAMYTLHWFVEQD
jgi:hypothetical protein